MVSGSKYSVRSMFFVGLSLLITASSAVAGPIGSVTFEKVGPGIGSAGQYNWNTGSNTINGILYTGSSSANHFVAFCMERAQFVSGGTTYTNEFHFTNLESAPNPPPAMSAATASDIRMMWAEYRNSLTNNQNSAAFQHAVWKLLDPSYNPGISGGVLSDYNMFLDSNTWNSGSANLIAMSSVNFQDQVLELRPGFTVDPNGDIVQVPVPAPAGLLVALVMGPFVVFRRRMARRTKC